MPLTAKDETLHDKIKIKWLPHQIKDLLTEIQKVILAGANVNSVTEEGTPLHHAARKGYFEVVKYLVENGADINLTDAEFKTAIDIAANQQILNYLIEHHKSIALNANNDSIMQLSKLIEFCIEYYSGSKESEDKDRLLLDYAVSKLTRKNIDILRKSTSSAVGRHAEHWNKYIGHLRSLAAIDRKSGNVEGFSQCDFLPLRIRSFFEVIIKVKKGYIALDELPRIIEGDLKGNRSAILVKLYQELLTEIETLHIRWLCENQLADEAIITKNILAKLSNSQEPIEYCIASGWEGHSVYVNLSKTMKPVAEIEPRIDNLGNGCNRSYYNTTTNKYETLHQPEDQIKFDKIRPCILNPFHHNLEYYIKNVIHVIQKQVKSNDGIRLIYNVINNQSTTSPNHLPFYHIQRVGNCTVEAHQIGLQLRLGHLGLYEWLLKRELEIASQGLDSFKLTLDKQTIVDLLFREQQKRSLPISLQHNLKKYYSKKPYIEFPFAGSNPLHFDKSIFNLTVITHILQQTQSQIVTGTNIKKQWVNFTEDWQSRSLHNSDKNYASQMPIAATDIFKQCNGLTRRIAVIGSAGIGKSTFLHKIANDWATEKLWPGQFKWLCRIPLRNLTGTNYPPKQSQQAYTLLDIFKHECKPAKDLFDICDLNPDEVLWLLDGFDELSKSIPAQLQVACNALFSAKNLIITTRPYQLPDFNIDVYLELAGFTDENIHDYIHYYFSNTINLQFQKASSLLTHLKTNPASWALARSPLMLSFTCWLYSSRENKFETATELYQQIIDTLPFKNNTFSSLSKFDREEVMQFLEILAFQAMRQGDRLLIDCSIINDIITMLQQPNKDNNTISQKTFFHKIPTNKLSLKINDLLSTNFLKVARYETDKTPVQIYFIHPSLQEFFAAVYIAKSFMTQQTINLLPKQATYPTDQATTVAEFVSIHKFDQRYERVWWFVAGLLARENKKHLHAFFELLQQPPSDLFGISEICLLIRCLDETKLDPVLMQNSPIFQRILTWLDKVRISKGYELKRYFGYYLNLCPYFLKNHNVTEHLLCGLDRIGDPLMKRGTVQLLSLLKEELLAPSIITSLFDLLYTTTTFDSKILAGSILCRLALKNEKVLQEYLSIPMGDYDVFAYTVRSFKQLKLSESVKQILLQHKYKYVTCALLSKEQLLELAKDSNDFQAFLLELARAPNLQGHAGAKAIYVLLQLNISEPVFVENIWCKVNWHIELDSYSAVEGALRIMINMPALQKAVLTKLLFCLNTNDWATAVNVISHITSLLDESTIDKLNRSICMGCSNYPPLTALEALVTLSLNKVFLSSWLTTLCAHYIDTKGWEEALITLAIIYPQVIISIRNHLPLLSPQIEKKITNKLIALGIINAEWLQLLLTALTVRDDKVKLAAIKHLGDLGRIDGGIIKALVTAIAGKYGDIYKEGILSITKLAALRIEVIDQLLNTSLEVAVAVIEKLGTASQKQTERLRQLSNSSISTELRARISTITKLYAVEEPINNSNDQEKEDNEIIILLQKYCKNYDQIFLQEISNYFMQHPTALVLYDYQLTFKYCSKNYQFRFTEEQMVHFVYDWATLLNKSQLSLTMVNCTQQDVAVLEVAQQQSLGELGLPEQTNRIVIEGIKQLGINESSSKRAIDKESEIASINKKPKIA
jgi:hypothetical protein